MHNASPSTEPTGASELGRSAQWVLLPVGPLTDAMEQTARRRQVPVFRLLGSRNLYRSLLRARAAGRISLELVEAVCDALDWHARMVYGDLWDAAASTADATVRTSARSRRRTRARTAGGGAA
jgi:hypothetical protein